LALLDSEVERSYRPAPVKRGGLIKFLVVMGLVVVFVVGCSVLLRSGGSGGGGGTDEEAELSTMTFQQFNAVQNGITQKELEDEFGPVVPRETVVSAGVIADDPLTANCVYYKADPPTFGEWFEFCFEGGQLVNKNSL
jgi:hypothetical protein